MLRTLTLFIAVAACGIAAELAGVVVADHDGSPVAGAAVTLRGATGAVAAELETDDTGRFRAPNLPAGQYVASGAKANFMAGERRVNVTANQAVTIRMIRHGVVTGSVMDTQGQVVRNAVVSAIPLPAGGIPVGGAGALLRVRATGASTDARGRYRVFGLTPGSYVIAMAVGDPRSVIADARGITPDTSLGNDVQLYPSNAHPQVFTIQGGEEHKADFMAYRGPMFSIRGTVAGAEGGFRIALQREDLPGVRLGGVTSSNGAFEFLRVIPGTYRVTASAASTPIMIMENGTVVGVRDGPKADPSFGTISVTVGTQEVTGAMIPMARGIRPKLLYQPEAGCSAAASIMLSPMVEWGGGTVRNDLQAGKEVTLAELPLSPFAVELSAPGPAVCFTPLTEIDLNQASPDSPIVIPGIRFGAIQGKADTAGQPAEDFEVVLTPSDGTAAKRFALDAAARFAIPNLRPGRYRVGARRIAGPGVPKEMQEIEVGSGSSIEIEFPATP